MLEKTVADTFSCRRSLEVNGRSYGYYSLADLPARFRVARLPYSLKILLENLLRHENGVDVSAADIEAKMRALRLVGVPYTEEQIKGARAELQGKSEMDALIAYLQGLGTALKSKAN